MILAPAPTRLPLRTVLVPNQKAGDAEAARTLVEEQQCPGQQISVLREEAEIRHR